MKICRTIAETRVEVARLRADGMIGLVPTMGALHEGHMALAKASVDANAHTIASIFVNPTQFGDPADLEKYPRTEEADFAMLKAAGVSAVFMPSVEEMYVEGDETIVETTHLANIMHGKVRPGHYRGVTTVVSKLFNIVQPDNAYFGKKDYQQLCIIRRMVKDLYMNLVITGVETVREEDGLAMSSRNRRLTPEHRAAAPVLHRSLVKAETVLQNGGTIEEAVAVIEDIINAEPLGALTAIDVVEADSFAPASGKPKGTIGFMISAQFGDILLIDQKEVIL